MALMRRIDAEGSEVFRLDLEELALVKTTKEMGARRIRALM
jgi:hypothetical protein